MYIAFYFGVSLFESNCMGKLCMYNVNIKTTNLVEADDVEVVLLLR